ncbi:hypothetical protein [Altererythrobacter sp. MTPC7]|uniref:hypothetical protein n=1 Tax=Altererythrobacter sp. MTPC7 TaxID=3056567 RepID=UPI0036F3DD01
MRPILAMVAGLVDPDPLFRNQATKCLPSAIQDTPSGDIFALAVKIAKFVDARGEYVPSIHTEPTVGGLHAAGEILIDWPNGLDRINASTPNSSRSLQNLINDYVTLGDMRVVNEAEPEAEIRWAEHGSAHLATKPASKIARLSIETLEAIWNDGLVARYGRRHGNRIVPAFDEPELRSLAARWHDRRDAIETSTAYGIERYGVEQLAALEILPADGIGLSGSGPYFTTAALRRFEDDLTALSVTIVNEDTISLGDVMKMVGGRAKPWGPTILALLAGRINFEFRKGWKLTGTRIGRSDAGEVTRLRFNPDNHPTSTFDRHMNQADALGVLNASVHRTHLLEGLSRTVGHPKLLLVSEVEELAKQVITTAEIAMRLSMSFAAAHAFVTEAGLKPVRKGAFSRSSFEIMIGAEMRRVLLRLKRWDP